jgi:hypothetical protein
MEAARDRKAPRCFHQHGRYCRWFARILVFGRVGVGRKEAEEEAREKNNFAVMVGRSYFKTRLACVWVPWEPHVAEPHDTMASPPSAISSLTACSRN